MVLLTGSAVVIGASWAARGQLDAVGPGSPAPDLSAFTLNGDTVTLDDFAGNVILLNIWATWCPPCREEMPALERLHRHFMDQGAPFRILAVSIDAPQGKRDTLGNEGGDLAAFAREHDLTFTILHDPTGNIRRTYRTTGVPESFLIRKDGTIHRRVAGPAEWDAEGYKELIHGLMERADSTSGSRR